MKSLLFGKGGAKYLVLLTLVIKLYYFSKNSTVTQGHAQKL